MAIRIGFIPPFNEKWMGGVNYFWNLFKVIKEQSQNDVQCVAFIPPHCPESVILKYQQYAEVVFSPMRKKWHFWWLLKCSGKLFGLSFWKYFIKRHSIDLVSHIDKYENFGAPVLGWIPDFQHLHLPEYFDKKEIKRRNAIYKQMITKCDGVIFSSETATRDCEAFIGYSSKKFHILRFASTNIKLPAKKESVIATLKKFKLPAKYFHVPNQFWAHKNHHLLFEAVKCLREQAVDICVVCTGLFEDDRNPDYTPSLKAFITDNCLENNIRILGVVEYAEMIAILTQSFAVINPSLFEGWSTTVEECKSIGHPIILSDIKVHIEQKPAKCRYFKVTDLKSLTVTMADVWNHGWDKIVMEENNFSKKEDFYNKYYEIVETVLPKK